MTKVPTGYVEMSGLVISDEAMELIKEWSNGYHIANIPKGEYGEVSKIEEEIAELKDATSQGSKIMELVELSEIYGAIEGYLRKYRDWETDRKSTRLNSSHSGEARMPSSA